MPKSAMAVIPSAAPFVKGMVMMLLLLHPTLPMLLLLHPTLPMLLLVYPTLPMLTMPALVLRIERHALGIYRCGPLITLQPSQCVGKFYRRTENGSSGEYSCMHQCTSCWWQLWYCLLCCGVLPLVTISGW
eukprot:Rmarinus@m.11716